MSSRSDFISKRRRRAIYARDEWTCVWCEELCEKRGGLTLDHVVPRAHGGTHATRNLVTACLRCNSRRGSKSLLVFAHELCDDPALELGYPAQVVLRVLRHLELTILHLPTKRDLRGVKGQISMTLQEGQLR